MADPFQPLLARQQHAAHPPARRRGDGGAVAFDPAQADLVAQVAPSQLHRTAGLRQRSILEGVGRQLMQRQDE